jgi:hypothetical protein
MEDLLKRFQKVDKMKKIDLFLLLILFLINGFTFSQIKTSPNNARKVLTYLEERRDPTISTLFSIIPGFGHFYNKDYGLGVAFFSIRIFCLINSNSTIPFIPTENDHFNIRSDFRLHHVGDTMEQIFNYSTIPLILSDMYVAHERAKYINKKSKENLNVLVSFDRRNFNLTFNYAF